MKVLHISKYYHPYSGGVEQVVKDLCESTEYQADVLAFSDNGRTSTEFINGVKVFKCKPNLAFASGVVSCDYYKKLKEIISDYDILHVHLPNPFALVCLCLLRKAYPKIVVHWHSDIVKQNFLKLPFIPFQRYALKMAERIIVTTRSYANASVDLSNFRRKLAVIPIGIECNYTEDISFTQSLRQLYQEKTIVFSLGRHVYYKGFDVLIRAAEKLPNNFLVLLGGGGPLWEAHKQLINRLELSCKVILLGRVPDVELSSYYSVADVFCLPSNERSEAFGVVQIEAMAHGLPIVSCDITGSGVAEVNRHTSGRVVPVNDPTALARALLEVVSQSTDSLSCELKSFAENNFSVYRMRKLTAELYSNVLSGESARLD